jgi:RND superfamily putative drug exporter
MSTPRRLAALVCGRRTKWLMLALWFVLAGVGGVYGPKLTEAQVNDAASFLPAGSESTQVIELQAAFTGGQETVPAVVVYERDSGITPEDFVAVKAQAAEMAELSLVEQEVVGPIPSEDGQALQVVVPITFEDGFELGEAVTDLRAITADGPEGLTALVGGPAGLSGDIFEAFGDINGTLLLGTVLVVILVLLVTYRSPVLWIIPLLAVALADQLAQAINYFLADAGLIVVNGQTQSILLVLVFGAGTDYALLLIARYREELRRHEDRHEAMAEALHKAGPAVIASAATVAIGLTCLLFASLESTRGLGPAGAVGVLCALFAMITLLPALLVIFGRPLFWPFIPRFGSPSHEESGFFGRIGRGIVRKPRLIWVGTALVLGMVALNAVNINANGLSTEEQFKTATEGVLAQQVIEDHFASGVGSPVVVIGPADQADEISAVVAADPAIAAVAEPVVQGEYVEVLGTLSVPPDSQEAFDAIERLRADLDEVSTEALVGGSTAVDKDVEAANARDRLVVIPIVLAVVLVILIVLLRSLVAPVLLIATVVLSYFTTLGICAFVFSNVLGFPGTDSAFPIFAFIFLVALGIDYNIFLMTRVREESVRIGTRPGILRGLAVTGGVITSAGVVLAATFLILTRLPLVGPTQIGVAVAIGVLVDTLIVRSILVPALSYDFGPPIWWPSALARRGDPPPPAEVEDAPREPAPVG